MPAVNRAARRPATAHVAADRPAAKPKPAATQTPTKTAWKGNSTPAAARALYGHLRSEQGSQAAMKIIDAVTTQSDLARELNWEAAEITGVRPEPGTKNFIVDVTLEVIKSDTEVEKHYFGAVVDRRGKVLSVPQG